MSDHNHVSFHLDWNFRPKLLENNSSLITASEHIKQNNS